MKRICSIDGCERDSSKRGFCEAHYARFRRYGDPLHIGGTTPGAAQRYFRDVVMAYEGDECLIWPFSRQSSGYGNLKADGKMRLVSRLVCEEHCGPPPPKHDAAHSCGKGHEGCVTKRHLSWKTRKENMADTVAHGTTNRGERCGSAKLTEAQAREILAMKDKVPISEIARTFNVSRAAIHQIHKRQNWSWVTPVEETPTREIGWRRSHTEYMTLIGAFDR